jgi:PAS domain S-box-containing protein
MKIAPLPANEAQRLATLKKYNILDTEPETAFTSMVELAAYICQTPIAAISLIDEHRQWFKAIVGIDATETPRDIAFCAHTILQDIMIVPDATKDERFFDNPFVSMESGIRFYAGVTLVTPDGYHLGTLCVIDTVPRELSTEQLDAIKTLTSNIVAHLDLRLSHQQIRHYVDDLQLAATIFESSSEAMIVSDANNRIITVNPAFTTLTGYTYEEVVGKNPSLLKSGKQSPEFYRQMWTELNSQGKWQGEIWNHRKSGDIYAERLSINIIYNEGHL